MLKKNFIFFLYLIFSLNRLNAQEPSPKLNIIPSSFTEDIKNHDTVKYLIFSEITTIGFMFIGMEVLYKMPNNFTNWTDGDKKYNPNKWAENNKKGPVMDKDPFIVNLVQHPYWGGVYYMQGRRAGLSPLNSFLLSAFNSTLWEFGIEAFEERPSIQDLIFTPVLGALVGEGFFQLTRYISDNNNKLFGSKILGQFSMLAMDPMGYIIERTPIHKKVLNKHLQPEAQATLHLNHNEVAFHLSLIF